MTEYKLTRKVQEIAGATLTVALPKPWADAHGIKKGTEVELRYNGVVKIIPPESLEGIDVSTLFSTPSFSITLEGTLENGSLTFKSGENKTTSKTGNITALLDKYGIVELARSFVLALKNNGFPEIPTKLMHSELEKICGVKEVK